MATHHLFGLGGCAVAHGPHTWLVFRALDRIDSAGRTNHQSGSTGSAGLKDGTVKRIMTEIRRLKVVILK